MSRRVAEPIPLTCIELFAGCGGLALGLHRAGWKSLFAIERDPMAFETFAANLINHDAPFKAFDEWPNWLPKTSLDVVDLLGDPDIRTRLSSLQGSIDMVAGGPPCQGFSVGGKRDGGDDRNSLVYRMLEFVELVQPRAVLIENVEGMTRRFLARPGAASTSVADDVISKLGEMGYVASYQLINSADFGVPQARKRVAIIGVKDASIDREKLRGFIADAIERAASETRLFNSLPVEGIVTVQDAIEDLSGTRMIPCPDSPRFMSGTYLQPRGAYAMLMREGVPKNAVPDSHRMTHHGDRVRAVYENAHATQKPGRLSKEFLLRSGTKKDKKVLLDSSAVVATITTHPDEYIHYKHPRNVTVREMARLQSFPDRFHFRGRYTINGPRRRFDVARCSQVGNAVPPLMGEGLGRAVIEVIERIWDLRSPQTVRQSNERKAEVLV